MPASRHTRRWSENVREGEAFSAECFVIGVPAMLIHQQLFNPVGSAVRVRLRSAHAILPAAIALNVARHDVPLAVLGPPPPFIVENLLGGQPVSVGEMRSAVLAAPIGAVFWQLNAPANEPAIYPPEGRDWGHDLLPGQGVLIQGTAGQTVIINWQWAEVPL